MARQARVLPFGSRRQVLSPIDIRTGEERRGLSESQRNIMAITSILQTLGQAEKKRRERLQLDRVATAIAGGASTIEAINAVAQQKPEIGTGIPGILQRVGGAFQPSPGGGVGQGIQQAIIGQALQQALAPKTPKFEQPTGGFARGTVTQTGPTGKVSVLQEPAKPKAIKPEKVFSPSELVNVRKGIQAGIDNLKETRISGNNAITQDSFIEEYKQKATEFGYSGASNRKQKQFDAIFDKKARRKSKRFDTSTVNATGEKVKLGWKPNSPEVKQARKELRTGTTKATTKEITDTDVRLQSAPDARLDPFWANLSTEEKKEIIQRLDENPENINQILRILQSG